MNPTWRHVKRVALLAIKERLTETRCEECKACQERHPDVSPTCAPVSVHHSHESGADPERGYAGTVDQGTRLGGQKSCRSCHQIKHRAHLTGRQNLQCWVEYDNGEQLDSLDEYERHTDGEDLAQYIVMQDPSLGTFPFVHPRTHEKDNTNDQRRDDTNVVPHPWVPTETEPGQKEGQAYSELKYTSATLFLERAKATLTRHIPGKSNRPIFCQMLR